MAKMKLNGQPQEVVDERRETYEARRKKRGEQDERPPFDRRFCLAKIPRHPDWYDGPERYCMNPRTHEVGSATRCKFHGGLSPEISEEDRHDPRTAAITHGMHAELDNLIRDFDEKDQALYDWVTTEWPEAYDIDLESDPQAALDFHRLAAEVVRAERGRGVLQEEGEVHEKPVRNDEGRVVVDDQGDVVTDKSEHYLAKMMHRQDDKITKLERELGITRKERLKQDTADSAVESIKSLAEVGSGLIARSEQEYDPDEQPWEDEQE